MKKLFVWFAGLLEDQNGRASRKAATLYICLFFQWLMINSSLQSGAVKVDQNILFLNGFIILFCLGAITAEFLMKMYELRDEKTKTSSTKTETIKSETT